VRGPAADGCVAQESVEPGALDLKAERATTEAFDPFWRAVARSPMHGVPRRTDEARVADRRPQSQAVEELETTRWQRFGERGRGGRATEEQNGVTTPSESASRCRARRSGADDRNVETRSFPMARHATKIAPTAWSRQVAE
jgi:hypothetical protein